MRSLNTLLFGLVLATSWFVGCSSSSDEQACTPGSSIACSGANQCPGFQVCQADGAGYDACDCSGGATSSSSSDGATTGATSGATTGATSGATTTGAGGAGATSSSSVSTSGAGGGGAWGPTALPGLSLWLHSAAGIIYDPQHPGVIIKWDDQSPHGHQAVVGGNQPGQGASIDPSALNGLDGVKCPSGGEFRIDDDASLQFGTGEHMIAAVVRTAPSSYFPAYYYLKEGLGTSIALQQPNGGTVGYTHGITELSVSVSTAAAKWYAVTLRGPAMELQVGPGSSSGPASSANVDNPGAWTFVCKAGIAFEIAELIVVKGHVTDTDYDKTRQYLDDKYGL